MKRSLVISCDGQLGDSMFIALPSSTISSVARRKDDLCFRPSRPAKNERIWTEFHERTFVAQGPWAAARKFFSNRRKSRLTADVVVCLGMISRVEKL